MKKIKLSTAILKGCKIRPRKVAYAYVKGGKCGCAIGAAVAAVESGRLDNEEVPVQAIKIWPRLLGKLVKTLPQRVYYVDNNLLGQISHATEFHTREWIARRLQKAGL